jgi:hypothetical protein
MQETRSDAELLGRATQEPELFGVERRSAVRARNALTAGGPKELDRTPVKRTRAQWGTPFGRERSQA